MSACTTPESGNVGLIVAHTINPPIINEQGSYGKKDISKISPWSAVSVQEGLTPFQNEMDSDRLVLAATH